MNKKFRVAGNVINELSEKIPSNVIALNELIKNSYDASAKEVTVTLDTQKMILSIIDDGDGMDDSEIDALLQISKSNKKYGTINPNNKRYVQGSKGLGFLAVFKFGDSVHWTTVKKAEKRVFHVEYQEVIELDDLSDYSVEITEEHGVEEENGTKIDITVRNLQSAKLLKEYLESKENLDKLLNAFLDDNFKISIIIDGVTCSTKTDRSLVNYYPENRFFSVEYNSETNQVVVDCFDHYAYKNNGDKHHVLKFKEHVDSRIRLKIRLMIFDFTNGQKGVEPDKQFVLKKKITPLIFINNNFFSNYELFDPESLRYTQSSKALPQMIGYVEIFSSDEKIQFNSDRTRFQENELTIAIQNSLESINRFIQTQCSKIKSGFESLKSKQGKEGKKDKPNPEQKDGTTGTENDQNQYANQKTSGDNENKERENEDKQDQVHPVVLKIRSAPNLTISCGQLDLREYIISATDSKGKTIPLNKIEISVDGDKCENGILESVLTPCEKKVLFTYTDPHTGIAQESITLSFIAKPINTAKSKKVLIPQRGKDSYKIRFEQNPVTDLVSQLNQLYATEHTNYSEVITCALRAIFELSIYELELKNKIVYSKKASLESKAYSLGYAVGTDNHVITEISKSMEIANFHDLKNEILNTPYDKIVEKCHLGAHKSTLNLVPSDINEVGQKASLFLVIAHELLNNPNITWGKNGQPHEIAVK